MTLDHFPWHTASQGTGRSLSPAYAQFAPLFDSYAVRGMQINLPRSPVIAVQSITYLDSTLASQTLDPATYIVDTSGEIGRIMPVPGAIWPYQLNYIPGSVQVTFTAGFTKTVTETLAVASNLLAPSQPQSTVPSVSYASNGTALTLAISNPAQGHYTYANGVVSVNALDNNVNLILSYRTPDVPFTVKQAIMLLVGSWYQTREGVTTMNMKNVPLGINALLGCNRHFVFTLGN
jgi:hypothetical protein